MSICSPAENFRAVRGAEPDSLYPTLYNPRNRHTQTQYISGRKWEIWDKG